MSFEKRKENNNELLLQHDDDVFKNISQIYAYIHIPCR